MHVCILILVARGSWFHGCEESGMHWIPVVNLDLHHCEKQTVDGAEIKKIIGWLDTDFVSFWIVATHRSCTTNLLEACALLGRTCLSPVPPPFNPTYAHVIGRKSSEGDIAEGGDWEYFKNVPFLHPEASHSLPPQLIDTIFKLKMKACNINCTRVCLYPSKLLCAQIDRGWRSPWPSRPCFGDFFWKTAHVQLPPTTSLLHFISLQSYLYNTRIPYHQKSCDLVQWIVRSSTRVPEK